MNAFAQLLTNPAIISLLVGGFIGTYATLKLPSAFVELISIYLIFTIGFKGGLCYGAIDQCTTSPLGRLAIIGILLGFIQPLIHYYILRKITTLHRETIAVIAAEYGSISIVTFITAVTFLNERAITYGRFMPAVAGIMEIPAIITGLWIIKHDQHNLGLFPLLKNIMQAMLTCKKLSFIFIGFASGLFLSQYPIDFISQAIIWPFTAILILFMIDIGTKIATQKNAIKQFSPALLGFAIGMPIINGCIGLLVASQFAEHFGSVLLFAVLTSSASYIAVPAVMRTQAPDAQEAIYLPLALGVTLPFNIIIGIPLYYYIGQYLHMFSI
ncbi:MAG TPA: sodium-dependent bicarbonate transport family permease [Candidatus Dependentiae bacterium]|nr:sodium-dependent bicarbonate transport family permease [Candidatus Dependentiae bacterium]HRQ63076.1 sodium-dependent bicarbonate transport family permease [Candidatus Dependentiae bacterium]